MAYNNEAKLLLDQLNASRESLISLLQKYETVAQKTSSLHEACDQLMADQVYRQKKLSWKNTVSNLKTFLRQS